MYGNSTMYYISHSGWVTRIIVISDTLEMTASPSNVLCVTIAIQSIVQSIDIASSGHFFDSVHL